MAKKLTSQGVTEAWASSLDGVLQRDISGINARTAETCAQHAVFKPIGVINPVLPRWQDDIERCATQHHMRGIRLHPNYHGYSLDDPRIVELLKLATSRKLFVQIVCAMEDERTQHPKMQVPVVDISPLPKALTAAPGTKLMLMNWPRLSGGKLTMSLFKDTPVMFDISLLEGIAGIEGLLEELPLERLVFGSYAPVFYFEAAKLKLQESALNDRQLNAITHENVARFVR